MGAMIDVPTFLTIMVSVLIGNLALVFPLFLWNRAEANSGRRAMTGMIDAINKEMKDFHGEMKALHEKFYSKFYSLEQQQAKAVMERLLKIQVSQ